MCTYNGGLYLKEQLDSIAAQRRLPDELIICDDNSNDNTIEIIRKFASEVSFPVNVTINEMTLGVTKNFEKAISLCTGEIIFLSDQDDVWHPDKILLIEALFQKKTNIGAIISNAEIVDEHLKPKGYTLFHPYRFSPNFFSSNKQRRFLSGEAFSIIANYKIVTGATMAFRSQFREVLLPIPISWTHDRWIGLIVAAIADLSFIEQPTVMYRQHQKNEIGGPQNNLRNLLTKAKKNGRAFYQEEINKFNLVHDRLLTICNEKMKPEDLLFVEGKLNHLKRCSLMPKKIIHRLGIIFNEFLRGGYYRYSSGWQQAVLDIFCFN